MMANVCRCGSGLDYADCCALFHRSLVLPPTAEALMRSRFSAYCLQNAEYLLATWDEVSRPKQLDFDGDRQQWLKLEIIACQQGGADDHEGTVEFNASVHDKKRSPLKLWQNTEFLRNRTRCHTSTSYRLC